MIVTLLCTYHKLPALRNKMQILPIARPVMSEMLFFLPPTQKWLLGWKEGDPWNPFWKMQMSERGFLLLLFCAGRMTYINWTCPAYPMRLHWLVNTLAAVQPDLRSLPVIWGFAAILLRSFIALGTQLCPFSPYTSLSLPFSCSPFFLPSLSPLITFSHHLLDLLVIAQIWVLAGTLNGW